MSNETKRNFARDLTVSFLLDASLCLCVGVMVAGLAPAARAELVVKAVRSEKALVESREAREKPVKPEASEPVVKADNFGKIVSPMAKKWKEEPVPGYRNFGQWVSSQRRPVKKPKVPRDPKDLLDPSSPVSPSDPVATLPPGKGNDKEIPRGTPPNSGSPSRPIARTEVGFGT